MNVYLGSLLRIHWLGDNPQPDSAQAADGMRHVGFRVLLVLYLSLPLLQKCNIARPV